MVGKTLLEKPTKLPIIVHNLLTDKPARPQQVHNHRIHKLGLVPQFLHLNINISIITKTLLFLLLLALRDKLFIPFVNGLAQFARLDAVIRWSEPCHILV